MGEDENAGNLLDSLKGQLAAPFKRMSFDKDEIYTAKCINLGLQSVRQASEFWRCLGLVPSLAEIDAADLLIQRLVNAKDHPALEEDKPDED